MLVVAAALSRSSVPLASVSVPVRLLALSPTRKVPVVLTTRLPAPLMVPAQAALAPLPSPSWTVEFWAMLMPPVLVLAPVSTSLSLPWTSSLAVSMMSPA